MGRHEAGTCWGWRYMHGSHARQHVSESVWGVRGVCELCVGVVVHVCRCSVHEPHPPGPERAAFSVGSTLSPGRGSLLTGWGDSRSTGGLQSPRVPRAIQDPAVLQHPEADLSRVGEGPARGLEVSEVGCPGLERVHYVASWPPLPLPIPREEAGVFVRPPSVPDSPPSLPPGSQT